MSERNYPFKLNITYVNPFLKHPRDSHLACVFFNISKMQHVNKYMKIKKISITLTMIEKDYHHTEIQF